MRTLSSLHFENLTSDDATSNFPMNEVWMKYANVSNYFSNFDRCAIGSLTPADGYYQKWFDVKETIQCTLQYHDVGRRWRRLNRIYPPLDCPARLVVVLCLKWYVVQKDPPIFGSFNSKFISSQVVGATEEVEDEEMQHEGVATVLTALGHHFMQTPGGNVVKVERDIDYDDNIIYRFVLTNDIVS